MACSKASSSRSRRASTSVDDSTRYRSSGPIGATAAISGALDVWREGTPSEGHEALGGTKAQRTNWRTEFSWTVYLVGSTGVLPEAPRVEASAPIKSGTVSANNGVVTLSLAVDFGPLPRRVLDAVEVLDGQRVLLVGRAAQGDMFSGD